MDGADYEIRIERTPCRVRAVLYDNQQRPCRLFEERFGGTPQNIRFGEIRVGHVRALAVEQGGAFISFKHGTDAFMSCGTGAILHEGQQVCVKCVAGARREKAARVIQIQSLSDTPYDAFSAWRETLMSGTNISISEDNAGVAAAFDDALDGTVTLKKGGQLHIEHSRAVTAIDVDTAGYIGRGSKGARALSLNLMAVDEAARQIALRDLGGAIVIDCVAPINRHAADKIRTRFAAAFHKTSPRQCKTASPLPFGLLQAAIAWGFTPVRDVYIDTDGHLTAESRLLDLMALAYGEAVCARAHFFTLTLSPNTFAAYLIHKQACDDALYAFTSGRVRIVSGQTDGLSRQ